MVWARSINNRHSTVSGKYKIYFKNLKKFLIPIITMSFHISPPKDACQLFCFMDKIQILRRNILMFVLCPQILVCMYFWLTHSLPPTNIFKAFKINLHLKD